MDELSVFQKMNEIEPNPQLSLFGSPNNVQSKKLIEHRAWLQSIRHERPSTTKPFKIGVYIRYFNQTKHENYLAFHKKQFQDAISLCPNWQLIDFYVDEGATAPNMENAPAWSQLLCDCMDGKIDLIITQKISNVSKKTAEATLCARLLAAQTPPIGIYFVSEDMFTLASYYKEDLHDPFFLPSPDEPVLPESERILHD